jgi:hypothetical protein
MYCREVTRELAAPSAGADLAELERHLATCARCASEAQAARRLDRIWTATRPAEPSAAAWGRLWAAVCRAEESPATLPLADARPARRWLAPAVGIALIAQAAAVLLAVGIWLRRSDGPAPAVQFVRTAVPGQDVVFNVDPGTTLFLELSEENGSLVCTPRPVSTEDLVTFDSEGVPPTEMAGVADMIMMNAAESLE